MRREGRIIGWSAGWRQRLMSLRRRPLAAKQGVGGQSQAWGNTDLEHVTKDVKRRRWPKRAEVQEGGSEGLFMTPFDVVLPKEGANSLNGEINSNATQRNALQCDACCTSQSVAGHGLPQYRICDRPNP